MQKLLTGDIWKKVNEIVAIDQNKIVAIAYVTSVNLQLKKGDVLICNASESAIKNGETSAKTLEDYLNKGVEIYTHSTLHCKIFLSNDYLVLGSANLSNNSAERLVESAVITKDDIL